MDPQLSAHELENVSVRRNELIADIFHDVHYVEKWGKGISLILDKEPGAQFKEVATLFITVFKRKTIEEATKKAWKRQFLKFQRKSTQKSGQKLYLKGKLES